MFGNVVVGKPIDNINKVFATSDEDWNLKESKITLFTEERFLPKIMIQAGIVKSISEVRRNKPELMITLDSLDFKEIKWGKKKLFILVGE